MKGIKLTRLASGLAVSIVWKAAKGTHTHTTSPDTISASSSTSHDLLTGSRVPHVAPILWATTPPNLSCFHLGHPVAGLVLKSVTRACFQAGIWITPA